MRTLKGSGALTHQGADSAALRIERVSKVFDGDVHALRGVDLDFRRGEFTTLLGPSGSGKTTLLMIVAGFARPDDGRVLAGGVDLTSIAPQRRGFGVVFQNYALFPHMTVDQNVAYPLVARRIPRGERRALVDGALDLVGLVGLGSRRPGQLSGGQQQRVALARALVYSPRVLLLDEPLGALDRALRERMQIELRTLNRKLGITFVSVTHDQEEALITSDRIVVMRDGGVEQIGTPQEIYERPATGFVAGFVGASNLLSGHVVKSSSGWAVVRLDEGLELKLPFSLAQSPGARVCMTVRPERVRVHSTSPELQEPAVVVRGVLDQAVFSGDLWRYQIAASQLRLEARMQRRVPEAIGSSLYASWDPADTWVIPEGNEAVGGNRRGQEVELRSSALVPPRPEISLHTGVNRRHVHED